MATIIWPVAEVMTIIVMSISSCLWYICIIYVYKYLHVCICSFIYTYNIDI